MTNIHKLAATVDTVQWGYFDRDIEPKISIEDGDILEIEALSHHAGDAPDLMMDDAIREIYETVTDRGPGVHIMTGPVEVKGAKVGDVLAVKVLDLQPRLLYGSNFQASWGQLNKEFKDKKHVTIYRADVNTNWNTAEFAYEYQMTDDKAGQITEPDSVERKEALKGVRVPLRLHLGVSGVARKESGRFNSIPPGYFGGNVDNQNFSVNSTMYYRVHKDGAMYYTGDSHFSQGDGELNGTAIEAHVNATLKLSVEKELKLLNNPILETDTFWVLHGFNEDLDEAMRDCANEAVAFLEANKGLSKEEAYSLLSVAGDFHVTQVVDGVKGIHCRIRKDLFSPEK